MTHTLKLFRLVRNDGTVEGWAVEFPSGQVAIDWNRTAWPVEERLDHPHISLYGSRADVEQVTGEVEQLSIREVRE